MTYVGISPYSVCRFDAEFVHDEIKALSNEHEDKTIIVLTDGSVDLGHTDNIHVINYSEKRNIFLKINLDNHLVILAIDNDEVASNAVADILAKSGKFIPIRKWGKASYFHTNLVWRKAAHEEFLHQRKEGFSKWDTLDFDNLVQAIEKTSHIDGDYVEIGCFRGSSGSAVLSYLNAKNRMMNCWFFDVFDGFNYPTAKTSADALWLGTHETEGMEIVAQRLKRFETNNLTVKVIKADIIETPLPTSLKKIAVANIDVDIYEGVLAALVKCAPLIAPGGIMFAEDVGHTPPLIGAKRAIDDFCKTDIAKKFTPFHIPQAQFALFRSHES